MVYVCLVKAISIHTYPLNTIESYINRFALKANDSRGIHVYFNVLAK